MTREQAVERLAAVLCGHARLGALVSVDDAERLGRAGIADGPEVAERGWMGRAAAVLDSLGLTVAPPPSEYLTPADVAHVTTTAIHAVADAKDAEIARLRGENEKLRGVRVALADLQVSDEVRDQLAAIEREVREAHAQEIASLRAEVARLRQPPPSPSRDTYTVEVPAALVERVREARCRLDATANRPADSSMTPADVGAVYFAEDAATRALADAVLSQLGAKP